MKKLLMILLLALLTININCGGGGGSGSSAKTSLVTITVGNSSSGQAMGSFFKKLMSDMATEAVPSNVNKIVFTIAAPGMSTITKDVLVAGRTSITETFSIPNGNNWYFLVEAKDISGEVVLYRGYTTVNLYGRPVTLNIYMTALDTTPPTVISTSPANSATGVPITSVIIITFSETIDTATFNSSTFTLRNNGNNVAGTITVNGALVTFTPSSNLAYSTTYTGTITTGVRDPVGNAMAADYIWSFTTGPAPDTTPPTVTAVSPGIGATDVPVTSTLTATFSEAMNASTINTSAFTLSGSSPVSGTVTYTDTTATFTPSSNLDYGTTFTVTIKQDVKDLAGNPMNADYSWIFTTIAAPGETPPPDETPPSVPTGLTATPVNSTRIDLSWTASTDNIGVAGYKIYRNGTYRTSSASTSGRDTGLSPTTEYCYNVSAYDAAGNESAQSSQACATTFAPGYTVSGYVYEDGEGPYIPGVRITLSGTSFSFNTTTDSGGYYSFTDVQNGDYTIVPNRRGYYFIPKSIDITVSGADVPFMDFGAYPDIDLEVINANAKTSSPYRISFQVRNNGTADAINFEVYVRSYDGCFNEYIYVYISVPGGRSQSVTVYPTVQPLFFRIEADSSYIFTEPDECNNCTDDGGSQWCCG